MNFIKVPEDWKSNEELIKAVSLIMQMNDTSCISTESLEKINKACETAKSLPQVEWGEYNEALDVLVDSILSDESIGVLGNIIFIRFMTRDFIPIPYSACPGFKDFIDNYRDLVRAGRDLK